MINKTEQDIMQNWKGDVTKPIVSVCTITYNHEIYITEAIDSFLMQETDFPFEIVIGEDCSTDGTRKIIEEYVKNYPSIIKLIISKNNVGMQENGKRTMEACQGEYIALCEGDDYWTDPKKLQVQIDEMKKFKVDMSFHPASTEFSDGTIVPTKLQYEQRVYSVSELIQADFYFALTNTLVFAKKGLDNLDFDIMKRSVAGDIFIKIATSMNTGAICIVKDMSVYRFLSVGSWTENLGRGDNLLIVVQNILTITDEFDIFWNKKLSKELLFFKLKFVHALVARDVSDKVSKDKIIRQYWIHLSIFNKMKYTLVSNRILLIGVKIYRLLKRRLKESHL